MKDTSEYNVRAVERAISILECFDNENPERGVSEIAEVVDLHKATAHRIVTTLVNYGYLERAPDGQQYRLGLRLADLGAKVIRRMDLRREALPLMTQLVDQWDETCDLGIFDQNSVFYIEVLRGNHALTIAARVGQRLPSHATASGKLFLAHLSHDELNKVLKEPLNRYTDNTITSINALQQQFEQIRQQGYSLDSEELEIGISAVAAPIFSSTGDLIAAISIPCPTSRIVLEDAPELIHALIETAQQISFRMGWQG